MSGKQANEGIASISKHKGNLAETKVAADLMAKGFFVAHPREEFLPFDLVAIMSDGKNYVFYKVQVKYAEIDVHGAARADLRPRHETAARTGRKYTKGEVDVFAIYVPDVDRCFYVDSSIVDKNSRCFSVRISPPSDNVKNYNLMEDYTDFPVEAFIEVEE